MPHKLNIWRKQIRLLLETLLFHRERTFTIAGIFGTFLFLINPQTQFIFGQNPLSSPLFTEEEMSEQNENAENHIDEGILQNLSLENLDELVGIAGYDPEIITTFNEQEEVALIVRLKQSQFQTDHPEQLLSTQGELLSTVEKKQGDSDVITYGTLPYLALSANSPQFIELLHHPQVEKIYLDQLVEPELFDSIPRINADDVWNQGYTGSGYAVAILDTGVDKNHPFLANRVISEACYSNNLCPGGASSSLASGSGMPCTGANGCYHGTHVAGIAAGNGFSSGVAKDASIIAIQIYSEYNSDSICGYGNSPCVLSSTSKILAGLERVLQLQRDPNFTTPIAAANLSLGGSGHSSYCDSKYSFFKDVMDELKTEGVATVVSSGNEGFRDKVSMPACISTAVTVGATQKTSDAIWTTGNSATMVDLVAPGRSIYSSIPNGGYGYASGTSMSAPHVAGGFAVLRQYCPQASVDELEQIMKQTGVATVHPNNQLVFSRMDLLNALNSSTLQSLCGVPSLQKNPSTLNFSPLSPGDDQIKTITLSNSGTGKLEIRNVAVSNNTPFFLSSNSCSSRSLTSGQNCQLSVRFAPTRDGNFQSNLSFTTNDSTQQNISIPLSGSAAYPVLSLSRSSHNFGTISVGQSKDQNFTIINTGSAQLNMNLNQANVFAAPFTLKNNSCQSALLSNGQSCNFTVRFAPTEIGTKSDVLHLSANTEAENYTVNLSGTGQQKELTVSNSSLYFGKVAPGNTSQQTFTLKNTGNVSVSIGNIGGDNSLNSPFSFASSCSNRVLSPNASCLLRINFRPTELGSYYDTFNLPHDSIGGEKILTVSGLSAAPRLELDQESLDFRFVNRGQTETLFVTVKNRGNGSLILGSIGQTNSLAAPFSLSGDCSQAAIEPNGSCTFSVLFRPNRTGDFTDSFSLPSNDPSSPLLTMEVQGSSINPTKPIAHFSYSNTSGNLPLGIRFTDESFYAPTSWLWDFGDGQTSTEEHPRHYYIQEGTYTVTLTVRNDQGHDTLTRTNLITVLPRNTQPPANPPQVTIRPWPGEFINSLPEELREELLDRLFQQ